MIRLTFVKRPSSASPDLDVPTPWVKLEPRSSALSKSASKLDSAAAQHALLKTHQFFAVRKLSSSMCHGVVRVMHVLRLVGDNKQLEDLEAAYRLGVP